MNKLIQNTLVLSMATLGASTFTHAQDAVHEAGVTANSFGLGLYYGYQLNDEWTARASISGFDIDDDDAKVEFSGIDYEGDGEATYAGVGVDWRPFGGWGQNVYLSGGLASVEVDFYGDAQAVIGDNILVGDTSIAADSIGGLAVDIDFDQHIAPYVGLGWRSKAAGEAGFALTAELGMINLDDPEVTLTATDPDAVLTQANLDDEQQQIRDDLGGLSGYGSFGIGYRF